MRILEINLCTSLPGHPRSERIAKVRDFIEANGVDVCLFQEGFDICWPIYSTPRQLCPPGYSLFHHRYLGFLWFATFQVGIISRYPILTNPILTTQTVNIEVPQREWLDWIPLPGRRRAVAVIVNVPGQGTVGLASVHMSSSPNSQAERVEQFYKLASFIDNLTSDKMGFPYSLILGGDFNTTLGNPAMEALTNFSIGLKPLGLGSQPDFIFGRGLSMVSSSVVLTDGVTDHQGGYLVEVA